MPHDRVLSKSVALVKLFVGLFLCWFLFLTFSERAPFFGGREAKAEEWRIETEIMQSVGAKQWKLKKYPINSHA